MAFDQDGDAGIAKAIEDALAEIAGAKASVINMIDKAPPGPMPNRTSATRAQIELTYVVARIVPGAFGRQFSGLSVLLHTPYASF
jgi:hypothetical protein